MSKESQSPLFNEYNNKILRLVGIFTIAVLLVLLVLKGFNVVLLILGGVLVAAFFLGIAEFIQSKTPLPRIWSLIVAVLLILGVAIGTGFALAPSISEQVASLEEQLPRAAEKTIGELEDTSLGSSVIKKFKSLKIQPERSQVTKFFGSIFGLLSTTYIILFLGIFFMANPQIYVDGFVQLFPKPKRDRTREIMAILGQTLKKWLLGKLLSMLMVAILSGIGLSLLGVPLALTLALFAGLISFIPNFGPLLAVLPAFLLGYTVSPTTGLYVVLLYVAIQAIESNILTPIIQKKMISFPMAMVLIAQVVLGIFTGILGVILAVPFVAILMVLVKTIYIQDILKDASVEVEE